MKTKLIIPIVLGVVLFSCREATTEEKEVTQETIVAEEEHHYDENEAIVLDNGNKWVVVPEMMAFIKNIENGVVAFSKKKNTTFEEHKTLSILIDKNLEDLTSNCTMTGQAHDELHKWLLPFLDLASEYAESENIEDAKASFQKINQSFNEFKTYFE
ncbi:MAG: hypothetical protein AB7O47_07740 [Flavobacteriales bacterium]